MKKILFCFGFMMVSILSMGQTRMLIFESSRTILINDTTTTVMQLGFPQLREILGDTLIVMPVLDFEITDSQIEKFTQQIVRAKQSIDTLRGENMDLRKSNEEFQTAANKFQTAALRCEEQYQNQIKVTNNLESINRKNKWMYGGIGAGGGAVVTTVFIVVLKIILL